MIIRRRTDIKGDTFKKITEMKVVELIAMMATTAQLNRERVKLDFTGDYFNDIDGRSYDLEMRVCICAKDMILDKQLALDEINEMLDGIYAFAEQHEISIEDLLDNLRKGGDDKEHLASDDGFRQETAR